jgi:nucleotide-binding universal stress UspA family protein
MPFHRILVPVDNSDQNRRAVDVAAQLAGAQPDGVLVLLHVIETIEGAPEEEVRDFYATLEQQARQSMEALVVGAAARPATIERLIAYGRRGVEILKTAVECQADLVVLRSHRVDQARPEAGIGTLSHEVALLAEIPVLLVK